MLLCVNLCVETDMHNYMCLCLHVGACVCVCVHGEIDMELAGW